MDHTICPGSKFIRQPKPEQFTCPSCGEEVEIWSDEISAKCSSCATTVVRDGTMSCIEWCAMARDCVGEDAYNDFRELKATSVKDHLMELASAAVNDLGINLRFVERSLFYAENIARSEEAVLHVVLSGTVLGRIYGQHPERARSELLKMGFQLEDVEEVCSMVASPPGHAGEISVNESVVHDALLLAGMEERSAAGYAGDTENDPETLRFKLRTRSGSELVRHVTA